MYPLKIFIGNFNKNIILLIFGLGFFVRIILFKNESIVSLLSNRVEIATPVTSYKRLKEGLFLYEHGVSPYNGNLFHQAPLLLMLFSAIKSISHSQFFISLLYTITDLFSAWSILDLTGSVSLKNQSMNLYAKYISTSLFLFNPYSVISCLGMSTAIFTNCSILTSLSYLQRGKSMQSVFFLAIATYLSLYPILLLPPSILLLRKNNIKKMYMSTAKNVISFFVILLLLLLLSFLITNSWDFLSATYGSMLLVSDLTPNIGLWWKYPFFIIIILCGIMSILKPYPSIADIVLFMSLLPFLYPIYSYMRYSFITISCFLYCSFLGPAFYYLWIHAGSGNANFFYSITLVWNFNLSIIITDIVFAILKMELEIERPDMKGVDVIQINY
ncbi:hypothetical protein PORY_002718 [Pneumocystis oryctolagi]|uniref:Uncharacterized protein n=1 Tax=Pneumocystis oryctolagi TaxID=42067 RepID=A0ACB7C890_9ASCO|nr:hypothetical protein PORY_002718 [Pneumocystis oryctolagi]